MPASRVVDTFDLARRHWQVGAAPVRIDGVAEFQIMEGPYLVARVPAWPNGANIGTAAIARLIAGAPRLLRAVRLAVANRAIVGSDGFPWEEIEAALREATTSPADIDTRTHCTGDVK